MYNNDTKLSIKIDIYKLFYFKLFRYICSMITYDELKLYISSASSINDNDISEKYANAYQYLMDFLPIIDKKDVRVKTKHGMYYINSKDKVIDYTKCEYIYSDIIKGYINEMLPGYTIVDTRYDISIKEYEIRLCFYKFVNDKMTYNGDYHIKYYKTEKDAYDALRDLRHRYASHNFNKQTQVLTINRYVVIHSPIIFVS